MMMEVSIVWCIFANAMLQFIMAIKISKSDINSALVTVLYTCHVWLCRVVPQ